jgi:hypothetical protein
MRPLRRTAPFITVALVALGCATVMAIFWRSSAFLNQYDDAYITYRYAINLARGHGLVFNPGERTDSASSFLYTLLLSLLYRVGFHDLERVATCVGILCAGGITATVYWGALRLSESVWVSLLIALVCTAHGFISGWSISGMESVPYAFLVTAFVHHHWLRGSSGWGTFALLAAILLTRLEGLVVLAAWAGGNVFGLRGDRLERRRVVLQAACAAVVLALFFSIKSAYYGSPLPHAFRFKSVWTVYHAAPEEVTQLWRRTSFVVLILACGGIARLPGLRARIGVVAFLGASVLALLSGPRSDWARYSIHLLPTAFMLAAASLGAMKEQLRLVAVASLLGLILQAYESSRDVRTFMEEVSEHQRCRKDIGRRVAALNPAGVVLSSDIGAIAYKANRTKFLDAVGLTSSDVLDVYVRGGQIESVLDKKNLELVADTTDGDSYKALNFLRAPSNFMVPHATVEGSDQFHEVERIDECHAGGYVFAVGRLGTEESHAGL